MAAPLFSSTGRVCVCVFVCGVEVRRDGGVTRRERERGEVVVEYRK